VERKDRCSRITEKRGLEKPQKERDRNLPPQIQD
jgi:hypothetical protein